MLPEQQPTDKIILDFGFYKKETKLYEQICNFRRNYHYNYSYIKMSLKSPAKSLLQCFSTYSGVLNRRGGGGGGGGLTSTLEPLSKKKIKKRNKVCT